MRLGFGWLGSPVASVVRVGVRERSVIRAA
ncbi:MAG: hypothetical protein DVB22_003230 [Verrucomicrobia bacterium]|nr:MAG: hypothetical protein DVB22_003230 [Verrucomicrobiota bacterium]